MRQRSNGMSLRRMTVSLLVAYFTLLSNGRSVSAQASPPKNARQESPVSALERGKPIERQIAGGQSHSFKINAAASQYLHVVVQQRGVDVVVTLSAADGKKLTEVDNPNGAFGPESLSAVTDATGEYRVEVHPFKADAAAGAYEINLQEMRTSTERDKNRIAKLAAAAEARSVASALRNKEGVEALKSAIEAYQKALVLWREGEDKYWEAASLNQIGDLYYELDQMQQALDFYNQALRLRASFADGSLEGTILDNIALVYSQLNDSQKALEFYQQALPVQVAAKDRAGEARSLHNIGDTYYRLGEKQKALESYNRALSLRRDLGDRSGQANLLNNLGLVNRILGEKQKTLQFYSEALTLKRALGDQRGEATTLKNLGDAYYTWQQYEESLSTYNQALSLRRTVGGDQTEILNTIGLIYMSQGEKRKALEYFNQALTLIRAKGDRGDEATTINNIASVYDSLGEKQKALDLFNQALLVLKELGDRNGEATCYNNIGLLYYGLGEQQKALDFFNRALPIMQAVGNQRGYATTLTNIGGIHMALGDRQKALEFFGQAVSIWRAIGDRQSEAVTFNNIANAYDYLGNKGKALEYYNQALPILQALGDRSHVAAALNNIGALYLSLGETLKALTYYNQALPVLRELGDRSQEAITLINMGSAYSFLNEKQKALGFYNQGLSIQVDIKDRRGEAGARNAIGLVYDTIGERQKALEYYNQALVLWRAVGDRGGEATTIGNIAGTYFLLGAKDKAAEFFREALPMARAVGDRRTEAITLNNLMWIWKEDNQALAVFYGKQSVNVYQQLRGNIKGLEKETQKTFLHSVEESYRTLANLLIAQGRLPEAQQILGMLKEEEFFEFVRRDASEVAALSQRADLTAQEQKAFAEYARLADNIASIATRQGALKDKLKALPEGTTLPAAEQTEYERLTADLNTANKTFILFLDRMTGEFSKAQQSEIRENRGLQRDLKGWGAGTVSLYTIVGEDRYRVILTTPNTQVDGKTEIRAAELNQKVLAFREAVQNPNVDPRPLAEELYNILIKPIEKQLAGAEAKTLVWSLDGTLRYLPLAALFDGKQYLAEKYQQVIITLASRTRLSEPVSHKWRGLGLGVSQAGTVSAPGSTRRVGFKALTEVPAELNAIIRDENLSEGSATAAGVGVLPGRRLLDKEFTERAFADALGRNYSLVHIASHFSFLPGNADQSFLLLGDSTALTLESLRTSDDFDFKGVELLTLSACNTGVGTTGADGKEVEGFGAVAQERGAKAVLATLWPVADESTRKLMTRLYRIYATTDTVNKAEALRQAQISLLRGEEGGVSASGDRRSTEAVTAVEKPELLPYKPDPRAPFSHPFYWAPFILIGNWR